MAETKTTTRIKAADLFEPVMKAVTAAGPEGVTLKELEAKLDVRTRVLSNVTYRLEKDKKIRRVGEGRTIRYATTAAKATRKRTPKTTS